MQPGLVALGALLLAVVSVSGRALEALHRTDPLGPNPDADFDEAIKVAGKARMSVWAMKNNAQQKLKTASMFDLKAQATAILARNARKMREFAALAVRQAAEAHERARAAVQVADKLTSTAVSQKEKMEAEKATTTASKLEATAKNAAKNAMKYEQAAKRALARLKGKKAELEDALGRRMAAKAARLAKKEQDKFKCQKTVEGAKAADKGSASFKLLEIRRQCMMQCVSNDTNGVRSVAEEQARSDDAAHAFDIARQRAEAMANQTSVTNLKQVDRVKRALAAAKAKNQQLQQELVEAKDTIWRIKLNKVETLTGRAPLENAETQSLTSNGTQNETDNGTSQELAASRARCRSAKEKVWHAKRRVNRTQTAVNEWKGRINRTTLERIWAENESAWFTELTAKAQGNHSCLQDALQLAREAVDNATKKLKIAKERYLSARTSNTICGTKAETAYDRAENLTQALEEEPCGKLDDDPKKKALRDMVWQEMQRIAKEQGESAKEVKDKDTGAAEALVQTSVFQDRARKTRSKFPDEEDMAEFPPAVKKAWYEARNASKLEKDSELELVSAKMNLQQGKTLLANLTAAVHNITLKVKAAADDVKLYRSRAKDSDQRVLKIVAKAQELHTHLPELENANLDTAVDYENHFRSASLACFDYDSKRCFCRCNKLPGFKRDGCRSACAGRKAPLPPKVPVAEKMCLEKCMENEIYFLPHEKGAVEALYDLQKGYYPPQDPNAQPR